MEYDLDTHTLEDGRRRQRLLAGLAETDEVRRVHEALEQLYRTQLVAMELADRLVATDRPAGRSSVGPCVSDA